jgi:segregation and condensation protein B
MTQKEHDELADEATPEELLSQDAGAGEDPLAEFEGYESLDEEYPGDDKPDVVAVVGEGDEASAIDTPKQRRLAEMRLEARIESVIFASPKPLKVSEIIEIVGDPGVTEDDIQRSLDDIVAFYDARNGGFKLHYIKRLGYQFQTSEQAAAIMEKMFATRPRPISRAALETLSIIAYRQPVTRAEVEFIRGVDAGSIFKTLLERELIKCVGRKEIVGRPMLFGTSDEFLKVFNLSSIKDLPPLEAFQPAREVMQSAGEKLDEATDLVDIEEFIADNTRGESVEGTQLEGATATPEQQPETTPAGPDEDFAAAVDELAQKEIARFERVDDDAQGETNGTDADSEVAVPDGDSVETRSGDLDR